MNIEISDNNKLVIIGNGFDLAHGLKTRYTDFIDSVLQELYFEYSNKDKESSLNPFFSINKNKPSKVFSDLDSFRKSIPENERNGIIVKRNSYFFELIYGFQNKENQQWSNIELNFFKKMKRSLRDAKYHEIKTLNSEFEMIKKEFQIYLIKGPELTSTVQSKYISNIIFPRYIKNPLRIKLKEENLNIGLNPIHVLNFNYTKTFEQYLESSGMEINHIHGRLNNPKNPIIFGYGDETDEYYKKIEDIGDNAYLKHFKSFGYFKTENYQRLLRFLDFDKFDVLILGHSCGLSDRVMLKTIFEHQNCEEIQIFYYQWGEESWENDFEEKTMEISRHFSNKADMRKKLRPFNLSVPLSPYNQKI